MNKKAWIKGFKLFLTLVILFFVVQSLKGKEYVEAIKFSIFWGIISASVFLGTNHYFPAKGRACKWCK